MLKVGNELGLIGWLEAWHGQHDRPRRLVRQSGQQIRLLVGVEAVADCGEALDVVRYHDDHADGRAGIGQANGLESLASHACVASRMLHHGH